MKYASKRTSLVLLMLALLLLALPGSMASAQQPLPLPQAAGRTYISPQVLRILQNSGKKPTPVRVIVSFTTSKGRSLTGLTTQDVSTARASVLDGVPAGSYSVVSTFSNLPSVSILADRTAIDALAANPQVYAITLDHVIKMDMVEANALTGSTTVNSWGYTGDGVIAAVIDSGIDSDHPALVDDLVHQHCFRTENDCPGGNNVNSAEDQDGHGTHVSGMITGPNGVAPDAQIAMLKVFTTGDTSDTNILNALNYIILNQGTLNIDLLNMSLGGGNYSDQASCDLDNAPYVTAFSQINALGIAIFVSTGNDGQIDEIGAPGCISGAIGVGSTDDAAFEVSFGDCVEHGQADKVTCYSNATAIQGDGELVDLMAPGCFIISTGLAGVTNEPNCGTSMSTPYSLGVAALVVEYLNDHAMSMNPVQLEEHLEVTGKMVTDYRMAVSPLFPRVNPPRAIGALIVDTPLNFMITGTTISSVTMTWDPVVPAPTEYRIFRSTIGGDLVQIGTSPTPGYVDNATTCGEATYHVVAFDGTYESAPSNTDDANLRVCPLTPTNLSVVTSDTSPSATNSLTWIDNATDDVSYQVQRSLNSGGFSPIATPPANSTSYDDTPGSCGVYDYRVRAFNGVDYSAFSNIVRATVCPPDNDLFANAEVVANPALPTTPVYTDTEPNVKFASVSAGDPEHSCSFGGSSSRFQNVWYSITTGATPARVTVSTGTSTAQNVGDDLGPDTVLSAYTYDGSFTEVDCNDDISGSDLRSTLAVNLNANTTYYFLVAQWTELGATSTGSLITSFTFSSPPTPPTNDNFVSAEVVANPATTSSAFYIDTEPNIILATNEGLDPDHTCAFGGPDPRFQTLWYSVTTGASVPVNLVVDTSQTTARPSDFVPDTVISAYTYNGVSFTSIGCADDISGSDLRSILSVNLPTASTTYYIMVSQWEELTASAPGSLVTRFMFSPSPAAAPSNNLVLNFEGVTASYTDLTPHAQLATTTAGDPLHTCRTPPGVGGNNIWYGYIPPATGTITLDTATSSGSMADTVMSVYTGTPGAFNSVACNDNGPGETTSRLTNVPVTGGTAYTIQISRRAGASAAVGVYAFHFAFTPNPVVNVSPLTADVTEGGATDTYDVSLATVPSGDVTVNVLTDAQCSASPLALTFTTGNFATPQTVTVTAVDDAVAEGTHTCTITHSASGGGYGTAVIPSVTGTITDNDTAGVTIAPATADVTEGSTTDTYDVSLTSQPISDVTITVTGDAQCTVSPLTLTFTAVNYATTQPVTVTAVDDAVAEGPHGCTITHSASGGGYNAVVIASVTGTITDNDTAGVTVAPQTADVTEGGATDTYDVSLNTQPTADVTITVSGDAQCSVSPTTLTFTSVNYATTQPVTVTAVNDSVVEGTHTCTITHSASGGGYTGASIANVVGTVTDNETAGVTIAPQTADVTEGGATDTYNVSLLLQPSSDVTITVTGDAQCSVSPTTLTFTTANYATPQTVTVTAVNDTVVEGAHGCTITHSASGGNYNGVSIANVTGNITDNDVAGVTVAPTTADVTEGSTTDTYNVSLTMQPSSDVTITVTGDAQCSVSPTTLTFTTANFAATQAVTVTAIDDAVVEGGHTCTITHSASGGGYSGVSISNVTGTITDNDSIPATELLDNGGFEVQGPRPKDAASWKLKNSGNDLRVCNAAHAQAGTCSFRFTGAAGTRGKVVQNVDLTGHTLAAGDTLDLTAYLKRTGGAKIKFTLTIKYTGITAPAATKLKITPTAAYTQFSLPTVTLTGAVDSISVQFQEVTNTGKSWTDTVSLIWTDNSPRDDARGGALALPAAPGGMRGNN